MPAGLMSAIALQDQTDEVAQPAFLDVENSARGRRWVERLGRAELQQSEAIAQQCDVPQLLARVLAARGVTADAAADYLDPTLRQLMPDPSCLADMDDGVARLVQAIDRGETLAVFGDYDVDGASSVALMVRFLRAHGLEPLVHIPDRMTEGYGPNVGAFDALIDAGASLLVTVDCGTAAHEPVEHARERGADVIILDHHLAGEELPNATALINPNRHDDVSGQGALAAAGVVFLFLVAVTRALRTKGWYGESRPVVDLRRWLDLVALATVCDVVPLAGLNRAYVTKGLQVLRARENTGLRALADAAGLTAEPGAYHLGFVFGPRINAGGRLGSSELGATLLTSDDDLEAARIAATLDQLNGERKAVEAAMSEDAIAQAEHRLETEPDTPVLLVQGEDWHRGVVGLVASRLTERFSRPAIAIAWEADGTGTGSGRSIPGVNLGDIISAAVGQGLLIKGGGHAMAAGLTLIREGFAPFAVWLCEHVSADALQCPQSRLYPLDGALMPGGATTELVSLLERAGPFGAGSPRPRFAFPAHRCNYAKVVGDAHVRCTLSAGDGSRIGAIAFRAAGTPLGTLLLESGGKPLHVAGHLRRDQWGGHDRVELVIEDAAAMNRR